MTIPVRQEHPAGPSYQEALTYTFLIHSTKFARLTQMDDGQLVLIATGWTEETQSDERTCFILFSADEGQAGTGTTASSSSAGPCTSRCTAPSQ